MGFTHTWLSVPWMLWVFVLFWRQRFLLAGLSLGLLFNLHALHAAYTAVFIAAAFLGLYGHRQIWRLVVLALCAMLTALPTLVEILGQHAEQSPMWFDLMYVRSAEHSFPATLWREGDAGIVRFVACLLLAALGFPYIRDPFHKRMIAAIFIAFVLLLVIGYVAVDSATIIRAQLWRSSGLILLLSSLLIGAALVNSWREQGTWQRAWALLYSLAFLCAAVPGFHGYQYPVLFVLTLFSIALGHCSWRSAVLIALAHACMVLAYFTCSISLCTQVIDAHLENIDWTLTRSLLVLLSLAALLSLLWRLAKPDQAGFVTQVNLTTLALAAALLCYLFIALEREANPWTDMQKWVQMNTEIDACIASPHERSGFRIDSERAILGEWRDGTQLYFSSGFTEQWWQRMCSLENGLRYAPDDPDVVKRGRGIAFAPDEELLSIAAEWGVDYFVLPAARNSDLVSVYTNEQWQLCKPQRRPPPAIPAFAKKEEAWRAQETFIRDVIEPNIQRFRTCELTLRMLDQQQRPIHDIAYTLELQKHAFGFGSGLPFFKEHPKYRRGRFVPPLVQETDLTHFKQVFNFSTIPYSAKWFYIEPEEGKPFYDDLDAYVDWCVQHNIDLEYHFVTGYQPDWMKAKSAAEKQEALLRHTNNVIDRYGERIHHWQVVNEKKLLRESVAAFKVFRERLPDAQLGISDCARFYTKQPADSPKRARDLLRGMSEVKWLREQGVEIDFFAFHAHRPFGLWADLRVLYETLDAFKDEGLKIHISEFGMHENHQILGDVRGGKWTPALQAEYYALIYKACFSHPAVEVVNMWGASAHTWMPGSGIVDKEGKAKPAFYALQKLIHEELHTREEGIIPVHGRIQHRVFYGDYSLRLRLANGKEMLLPFALENNGRTDWTLTLDIENLRCLSIQPTE